MRSATAPGRPSADDYETCVTRSYRPGKTRLEARRAEVLAQYQAYAGSRGRPHMIATTSGWGEPDAGYQRGLYEHTWENGWLEDIRSDVFAAARRVCLLCNSAQPGSIDHVLPQSDYPALSIFGGNLIAACEKCNRLKSNTSNHDPERQFIHPYFEQIPRDVPFLRADLIANGVLSPQFEIVDHPDIDAELTARLRWQFAELEIGLLYRNEAVLSFQKRQYGWIEPAESGWAALETSVSGDRRSIVRAFGVNYWEAAFLQGLLDSPEFQADPMHYLTENVAELGAVI